MSAFALFLTLLCICVTKADPDSEIFIIGIIGWLLVLGTGFIVSISIKQLIREEYTIHRTIVNKKWKHIIRRHNGDNDHRYYISCDFNDQVKLNGHQHRYINEGDTIIALEMRGGEILVYTLDEWDKIVR